MKNWDVFSLHALNIQWTNKSIAQHFLWERTTKIKNKRKHKQEWTVFKHSDNCQLKKNIFFQRHCATHLFSKSSRTPIYLYHKQKTELFSKTKVYTDSFMLYAFLLLWSSTLQLLSLICSSGEEILNITSSQQRLDNNYQQMAGSRVLKERKKLPFLPKQPSTRSPKQLIGDSLG